MKKIIFYNIFIFLFVYTFAEILTGTLIFNKIDCHYLLCDRKITYKNPFGFYKNKKNFYEKGKYGFRGRTKPLNEIDILTIGGSTTDERYLNVKDTWSERLQEQFLKINKNIDVVNAGIDGQSTIGHIWNFENWFNKLEDFKPRYIIFYIGLNERLMDKEMSSFDHFYDLSKFSFLNKIVFLLKRNNGITYKIYNLLYRKLFLKDYIDVGHKLRTPVYKEATKNIILKDSHKQKLVDNLNKLVIYSKKLNAKPIFVTQKSLRGISVNGINYALGNLDILSFENQISKIIISFCFESKIDCVDLNKIVKFNTNDFYDLVHTTPTGSEKISSIIFENIKHLIK